MAIKVLAFDLDDTLWDMRPTLIRAEQKLHEWLKSNCPRISYDPETTRSLRNEVLQEHPELKTSISELRRRVIELALQRSGYTPTESESYSHEAFEAFLQARNQVLFFDGALDAVRELTQRYLLGTLTNGNADIQRLGLSDYFSFSFSAEQVGAPKPAPNLFHAALEHTGVKAQEMIYIGDHPEFDVGAAHDVGLHTIWVNLNERAFPGEVLPDEEIGQLSDLPAAVGRIDS
jgi:putative hydrolase of the HAD superfamily|tara:strand:- start:1535 stop:2230 length:696 start_codon:yes stop_codon:yes gene_type:complete